MSALKVGPPGDGVLHVEMQQAGRWELPKMPRHYDRVELASSPEESDLGTVTRLLYWK